LSSRAVGLTSVEYVVDPGFREWTIRARRRGLATIRSYGRPNCPSCTARRFRITIVVG
jgi:predicted secreted protein